MTLERTTSTTLALCVRLGERFFALEASHVQHVYAVVAWSPLAHPSSTTVGVVRIGERLLSVVNPRVALNLAVGRVELDHLLLELRGAKQNFLLWVDQVTDTLALERMHGQGLPLGGPIGAFGFAENLEYPVLEVNFFTP
jgi:chemotaxis signal transduction protein